MGSNGWWSCSGRCRSCWQLSIPSALHDGSRLPPHTRVLTPDGTTDGGGDGGATQMGDEIGVSFPHSEFSLSDIL